MREIMQGFSPDPFSHLRFAHTAKAYISETEVRELFAQTACRLHEEAARRAGKPRWADKHPLNTLQLPLWNRVLKNDWHWLHVVRNPVDTIASMIEIGFPLSLPVELESKIHWWRDMVEQGEAWRLANPDQSSRVDYETLVRQPESTLRRVMNELNEYYEPEQLSYQSDHNALEDPKARTHPKPHTHSIGRGYRLLSASDIETIIHQTDATCRRHNIHIPLPS